MSEQQRTEEIVKPDLEFVKDVIASGGGDLKKCYQCSTCTVVCGMTPDDKPFPRKEMLYAQWGMKEKLISNPDIWLCHQCSDCTAYCPRGAKPGEVLGAVRKMAIQHYSPPSFLAKMVNDPKYLLVLLAIPTIIFLFLLHIQGYLFGEIPRNEFGKISFSKMLYPTFYIDPVFISAALFAVVSFVMGIKKYWADMAKNYPLPPGSDTTTSLVETIKEIISHNNFKKCNVTKERSTAHMLVFFSFIGLGITTTWAVFYLYILGRPSPYPLYDPMKIVGNISAIGLLIGITLVTNNRLKNALKAGKGGYYDWLFIVVIYVIAVTGILAQLTRLADIAPLAYTIYFIHLVFVFFLFAYAPFSKMAHMVYRTTAMVFARQAKRQ
ncbi:MAG: quinone-interacting membrane-bound oxidoreductase complex subunit QmoC [Thermodesulfovibrionales bacterium]|nr:quinone-interacting membrane-bound oxidoreductase complex subunit QmoC [Thermodesulfovibrionales bacterium]